MHEGEYKFTKESVEGTRISDFQPLRKALELFQYETDDDILLAPMHEPDPATRSLCEWLDKIEPAVDNNRATYFHLYFWNAVANRFERGDFQTPHEEYGLCQNSSAGYLFIEDPLIVFTVFRFQRRESHKDDSSEVATRAANVVDLRSRYRYGEFETAIDEMLAPLSTMRGLLNLKKLIQVMPAEWGSTGEPPRHRADHRQ